ncbi:MAG: T9SS type A sorting domain-containing protein [Bacteroidetes bacterium]|nr:T9SS type A sorting domain-containing protein [Bacteroidota bacterium]MBP7399579.1 T9SS type A sorting domain-containing protein [Chitinophagales bacterium]MBK8486206.1 T9SS type A sorting domain-containing protein [Bacteroidota bacterium]MBK8681156.1 T9SS type A sorting domain-containing protein [Bacteroidota bacterium]MBP8754379.1 T9SS type A sorting domain-containing protein [Chitinophagales bacterium]
MKNYITLLFCLTSLSLLAQPVITNGDNFPTDGFTSPVSLGALPGGVGGPGENLTWDFSSLSLTEMGTQYYVDASTTPFIDSWPDANACFKIVTPLGSAFFYWVNSATKFEQLATGITSGPGSGSDYSPNMTTILVFPFTYGTSVADTYKKVGYSVDNVLVTYDAYGTLIMPYATYENVVRVKYEYDDGSDYAFWSVNPLLPLMTYNYEENSVTAFGVEIVTGINETITDDVAVYPNPASDILNITLNSGTAMFSLYNASGAMVGNQQLVNGVNAINTSTYPQGIYFFNIQGENTFKYGSIAIE